MFNKCKNAREIIVFYSNGFETYNLKWERRNAREGMITNTEEQNRQIARENVERYKKYKKEYNNEYNKSDMRKESNNKYQNQLCCFNGQTLTLHALSMRFMRQGIDHPAQEAKKYLTRS